LFKLSTIITAEPESESKTALVSGCSYAVLSIVEETVVQLIQFRNPLMDTDPVDTNTSEWNDGAKVYLKSIPQDPSTFWMSWGDVQKNFSSLNLCYGVSPRGVSWIRRSYSISFTLAPHFEPSTHYQLDVLEPTHFFFGIQQAREPFIDVTIMLWSISGNKLVHAPALSINKTTRVPIRLNPGRYVVIPYSSGYRLTSTEKNVEVRVVVDTDDASSANLTPLAVDRTLSRQASLQIFGTAPVRPFGNGHKLYVLKNGVVSMYAIEASSSVAVVLDFSQSINAISAINHLKDRIELTAGEKRIVQVVGPRDPTRMCTVSYEIKSEGE